MAGDERRALLELVDRLAEGWRPDAALEQARGELAGSGLWACGLPEVCGGGGADLATTQAVIARVSGRRASLGVAMAHLHAAGTALATAHPDLLTDAAEGRCSVAVVPADDAAEDIGRVDLLPGPAALVLVSGDGCRLAPASAVTHGPPVPRTGLDGLVSGPVQVEASGVEHLGTGPDPVRERLMVGLLAVAAGLADAAHRHARAYTAQRVQFGRPLDALPTMRERLADLRGHAAALLALAGRPELPGPDAPFLLRDAAERAVTAGRLSVQCFGGYGYLEEYPPARLFRDAISLRAAASALSALSPAPG